MAANDTDRYLAYLGSNVRRLRLARGKTQLQFAEDIKMNLRFLQRIESGAVNLRFHSFITLASNLNVPPGSLLRPVKVHEKRRGRPPKGLHQAVRSKGSPSLRYEPK